MIASSRFRRIIRSVARIAVLLVVIVGLVWFFGIRMPGRNTSKATALSATELALRAELKADVEKLAGEIGERNMNRYPQLLAADAFIESSLTSAGYTPRRDTYELRGRACHNVEVEIRGAMPEIFVVGAHYDSVSGCPGANDNGSGVAALLALARRFAGRATGKTLRFVAFVNEEPPYFQTEEMGSLVYAKRCQERGDRIVGMISLETIAYFSDAPGSQRYPTPGLGLFYPSKGNFIGFASGMRSRSLLRATVRLSAKPENFSAKAQLCPRSQRESAGRTTGRFGNAVIRRSWSPTPTPRRSGIRTTTSLPIRRTNWITIGSRSSSV